MKFFTADIHFADAFTMKTDNRPFRNIKEYDKFIVNNCNKTAKKGNTIYVVGDLLDCDGPDTHEWEIGLKQVKKINADIILIMGNNEDRIVKYFFDNNFEKFKHCCFEHGIKEVHRELIVETCGRKVNLVHQIKDGKKNMCNFFGHTHLCAGLYHPYGLCVSTDLNHFRLFTEEMLCGYLKRKHDYWEPDDNTNYVNPFIKLVDGKWVNVKQQKSKVWQDYAKHLKEDSQLD